MRVNKERKSVDIEERDIEYVMQAYIRLYLFNAKNEEPEKIIMPMFREVPHPYTKGKSIPIEYIPDTSPIALEIKEDGGDIPKATEKSEAKADEEESAYNRTKDEIAKVEKEAAKANEEIAKQDINPSEEEARAAAHSKAISPARAAFASQEPDPKLKGRVAKTAPGGALEPGTPSDYGPKRSSADVKVVRQAMAKEKDTSNEEALEMPDDEIVKRAKDKK
jgi:hypothetical protein